MGFVYKGKREAEEVPAKKQKQNEAALKQAVAKKKAETKNTKKSKKAESSSEDDSSSESEEQVKVESLRGFACLLNLVMTFFEPLWFLISDFVWCV